MSTRLERRLADLRSAGRRGLAPYVTAGDGGLDTTLAVLRALDEADVACVELGIPFSDPIADGPVLQAAAQRALEAGTTLDKVLDMLAAFREGDGEHAGSDLPVVLMTYANPVVRRGVGPTCRNIVRAGGDGLLVADLPVEEAGPMHSAATMAGLCPIFFVSPTTQDERLERAVAQSRGFLYAIGRFGVTGASTELGAESQAFLERVKRAAGDLPVAVGFGIGTPEQVRAATQHADLAIVGSALVRRLHDAHTEGGPAGAARTALEFARELSGGLR